MSAFIRGDAVIIPILSRTIRVDNANDLRAQPLLCPSFSAILRILFLFIGKRILTVLYTGWQKIQKRCLG